MRSKPKVVRPSVERTNPFLKHPELVTDPVFLIGNGSSRKDFNLERLRGIGTIIGCNALYRDFKPDLLICIDAKMITEVNKSGYHKENLVLTPGNRPGPPGMLKWRTERFNTSGCFGMLLIAQTIKPEKCYMLGMDNYVGNVYDGTINYAPNKVQNFSGIGKFYATALERNEKTTFINVNTKDEWPKEAKQHQHYEFMTYDEFENVLINKKST